MALLEELRSGATVNGVMPNQSVEVVSVEWIGDQAINLVYRAPGGSVSETTLYRNDEHRLVSVRPAAPGPSTPTARCCDS